MSNPQQEEKVPVRRNTWQREAVRTALEHAEGFVSAQALHGQIAESGTKIGLATVYRALASLVEGEEADALQSADGEVLYRACDMDVHHHHLICRECGRAEEIHAHEVEAWASRVAAEHGYSQPRHIVDVFGLCPECATRHARD